MVFMQYLCRSCRPLPSNQSFTGKLTATGGVYVIIGLVKMMKGVWGQTKQLQGPNVIDHVSY